MVQYSHDDAAYFLSIAHEFKLGRLPTESPHPKSEKLSYYAQNDLEKAFKIFHELDENVLNVLEAKWIELVQLKKKIAEVISSGGRIYLVGCGATGRLSLSLETFWREHFATSQILKNRVISFMAGGDVALIHSIEKFEDYPEFGERQLRENHFSANDLLIATTEGGETPFVIGATEAAASTSLHKPYFLYCNPDDLLKEVATRSKKVLENSKIEKINLTTGPMCLTGSTRLQASTILMAAVGFALLYFNETDDGVLDKIKKLKKLQQDFDYSVIKDFTAKEADHYRNDGTILYETSEHYAITILTDTTERSPTFSLYSFENQNDQEKNPSLVYLYLKNYTSVENAWQALLKRSPRTFHWQEVTAQTSSERILGFQFHRDLFNLRKNYLKKPDAIFKIDGVDVLKWSFQGVEKEINLRGLDLLSRQLMLKMLLNAHSTILMGRLNRYVDNLMTWVRPSNFKLIDRSVRYSKLLLAKQGKDVPYEELVKECYRLKDKISRNEAIVLKIVESFSC